MKEEIEIDLVEFRFFKAYKFPIRLSLPQWTEYKERTEYVFWKPVNFDLKTIKLNEGQKLQWFSQENINLIPPNMIAFDSKYIMNDFYQDQPYSKSL